MPRITVDGIAGEFPEGTRLIDAARDLGVHIPHYCYHEFLPVEGSCRLCLVEIDGGAKLQLSCATPVRDGMAVRTRTPEVLKARAAALEFLLLNHPLDCPICDKAGECPLQDYYFEHSAADTRTTVPKWRKGKRLDIGERILLDQERCILCGRCVRFMDEVAGEPCLGRFGRGHETRLDVMPGRRLDSRYSGNVVDLCPVGALTWKPFRFRKRPWFLEKSPSVCPHCAAGCTMTVEHENGRVHRQRPMRNPLANRAWMCDAGRLAHGLLERARAAGPALRAGGALRPAGRDEALGRAAGLLCEARRGGGVVVLISNYLSCEEAWLSLRLASQLKARGVVLMERPAGLVDPGPADGVLVDADRSPNRAGVARVIGLFRGLSVAGPERAAALLAGAGAALLVGPDLAADLPAEAARALAALPGGVAVTAHEGAFAALAAVLLPALDFAEKAGTFVNRGPVLQRFERALEPAPGRADDLEWLSALLAGCGGKAPGADPARAYAAFAGRLAGFPASRGEIPAGGVRVK